MDDGQKQQAYMNYLHLCLLKLLASTMAHVDGILILMRCSRNEMLGFLMKTKNIMS
jgi:hypothetical protein